MSPSTGYSLEVYGEAKKLPVEKLERWGLRTEGARVAIPYYGTDGRESGATRYRHSPDSTIRFTWSPGSVPTLYGLQFIAAARETGTIVLVEGESDTSTLWHHGYHAVGVPGAASFKNEWADHFDGFSTIYIVIEPDAGGEALLKCIAKHPSAFTDRVRLVIPTHFHDPSELHLDSPEHFKGRFDAALEGAEPWARYADRQAWVAEVEQEQDAPKDEWVPILTVLSDVEPEEVDWLWPDRVAQGKYNVLMGMPDLGKTTVALDIAARMSVGGTWPDGTVCPQSRSIFMTAEDGVADTIVPRLDKLGGDRAHIAVLEGKRNRTGRGSITLDHDLDMLEKAIEDFHPSLVIIDPLSAYLGDVNSHREAAVRGLLEPVIKMLERRRVALLAIAHLNKNAAQELMHRMGGSTGLQAAARAAMVVGKHPHDPDRRVLAQYKSNLIGRPRSLDYILDGGGLTWDANAPDIGDPRQLLNTPSPDEKSAVDEACEFLSDFLSRGPAKYTDVLRAAIPNGVAERTLRRARERLKVEAQQIGSRHGSYSEWRLPRDTHRLANALVRQPSENIKKNASQEKPVAPLAKEVGEL